MLKNLFFAHMLYMGVLCQFSDALGKPREGVHADRFQIGSYSFATVDVILTIVLAIIIAIIWKVNIFASLALSFGAGIVAHWFFCVPTEFNDKILGLT